MEVAPPTPELFLKVYKYFAIGSAAGTPIKVAAGVSGRGIGAFICDAFQDKKKFWDHWIVHVFSFLLG